MPDPARLAVFAAASIVLIATPGPSTIFIVTRGLSQGRRAAVVSALGVETADLAHIGAAILGLSALIASSAAAFMMVKYIGAAYLVYLGVRAVLAGRRQPAEGSGRGSAPSLGMGQIYRQAFLVHLLNPKVALFFLAFLPQFVDPARGPVTQQILLLGALFVVLGISIDLLYAGTSGTLGGWLQGRRAAVGRRGYATGAVYMGLGASVAVSGGETA